MHVGPPSCCCCCSAVDVVHLHVALVVVVAVALVLDDERCAGLKLIDGPVMDVPAVDVVVAAGLAEADAAVADAAAVASSRCPCVAAVVAPGWFQMFPAVVVESCCHLGRKLPMLSKNSM